MAIIRITLEENQIENKIRNKDVVKEPLWLIHGFMWWHLEMSYPVLCHGNVATSTEAHRRFYS